MPERYFVGVDGGGTKTIVALADETGRELIRRQGPAGLVDPRDPAAAAETVIALVRDAVREAGLEEPAAALCAGLAGVGNPAERETVRETLAASRVASRVQVSTDGEIALEGALGGGAGILLIAGTGSVAYGRGANGRVERCGGWGMIVGDEGSGYALARAALVAALRAADGRGPETRLLPLLLELLGLDAPRAIPPWVGRSGKAEIAALATHVVHAAEAGDAVARHVLETEARELALHVTALRDRLGPWTGEIPVVFHGGALRAATFAGMVTRVLETGEDGFRVRAPASDAVAGALQYARGMSAV